MQNITNTPERGSRPRSAFWFASGMVAFLLLALATSLWASAQPWFFYHIANPTREGYGYSHRAYGLNCDILISGDSTGLTDFVPAVIEQRTKLKACNVSEVRSNLDFVGTHYPIDDYLAHNRPPRFIVTGWTPADLNLEHPPLVGNYADAFAYGMQVRPGPWMWKAMIAQPRLALTFVIWAGLSVATDTLERLTGMRSAQAQVDERARRDSAHGMYYIKVPPQTTCDTYNEISSNYVISSNYAQNAASVAEFRRHYTTPQTQVMIYVTPVADCDPYLDELKKLSRGLGERPLQIMPVSHFNQTDIHLTPENAELYSAQVANDILSRMGSAPGAQTTDRMPQ